MNVLLIKFRTSFGMTFFPSKNQLRIFSKLSFTLLIIICDTYFDFIFIGTSWIKEYWIMLKHLQDQTFKLCILC